MVSKMMADMSPETLAAMSKSAGMNLSEEQARSMTEQMKNIKPEQMAKLMAVRRRTCTCAHAARLHVAHALCAALLAKSARRPLISDQRPVLSFTRSLQLPAPTPRCLPRDTVWRDRLPGTCRAGT